MFSEPCPALFLKADWGWAGASFMARDYRNEQGEAVDGQRTATLNWSPMVNSSRCVNLNKICVVPVFCCVFLFFPNWQPSPNPVLLTNLQSGRWNVWWRVKMSWQLAGNVNCAFKTKFGLDGFHAVKSRKPAITSTHESVNYVLRIASCL